MLAELRRMSGANEPDENQRKGKDSADRCRHDFAPERVRRSVVIRCGDSCHPDGRYSKA